MKTKITFLFTVVLMLFMTNILAAQEQVPSFSGEWELNRGTMAAENNQLFLSKLTIHHTSDSLMTTRVYENQWGELFPFNENLSLDREETKIWIYDMPRTSKASLSTEDGKLYFESVTTFYEGSGPVDLKTQEVWSIVNEGSVLKIDFTMAYSGGYFTGTQSFKRLN